MSEIRKTIQINPKYLIHDKKSTGRKKKARDDLTKNLAIQPNGVRDKLLQKIKDHRQRQNELKNTADSKPDTSDPFKTSLEYLNSVIQKSETKKQRRRQRRRKQLAVHTPQGIHNVTAKIRHNDDPPWGILKNGKKPLYSEYKRTLRKLDGGGEIPVQQKSIHYEKAILPKSTQILERKSKLTELKNNFITSNKNTKSKTQTLKKKRRYTLGKHGDSIGILIKSRATRKKIKREHKNLKKKKIKDIKLYLKKHGLLKVGSNAPEELCRSIYETAVLSGEIYNNNANLLLHNFINDK
jgi:septal ring factor EnvC (AmiA/AmiB activator)